MTEPVLIACDKCPWCFAKLSRTFHTPSGRVFCGSECRYAYYAYYTNRILWPFVPKRIRELHQLQLSLPLK